MLQFASGQDRLNRNQIYRPIRNNQITGQNIWKQYTSGNEDVYLYGTNRLWCKQEKDRAWWKISVEEMEWSLRTPRQLECRVERKQGQLQRSAESLPRVFSNVLTRTWMYSSYCTRIGKEPERCPAGNSTQLTQDLENLRIHGTEYSEDSCLGSEKYYMKHCFCLS